MAVAKAEILDAIANMTVLELSQMIKDMEEKFGVSPLLRLSPLRRLPPVVVPLLRKRRPNSPSS